MRRFAARVSPYALTTGGLVLFLAIIVFGNSLGHFHTDIKPEVYLAPWTMVERYLSSWTSSPYLGSANFNVGLVPVLLLLSALRGLGLSPEWTFKVFHFALWLVAAWGANRLVRAATVRATKWVGLFAGVFYLANPYTIAAGNTLAIALPMALLPWMLLAYLRGLQQPRSWAWPAAFGLAFFAMSGMNVAVVPLYQLLALVPIAAVALWHRRATWRQVLAVTAKCGLFVVAVSVYWLVPAIAALGTGAQIVDMSETLTGIHKVSSFTEVLRGLGLWPLYGHSDTGPWVPQNATYITSPVVIVLTALWPTLALVSLAFARTALRRTLVLLAALAAVVMVGLFPGEGRAQSPVGWVLEKVLGLGPLAAFRTTNKIGALLALAFALALAFGAVQLVRLVQRRSALAPVAGSLATVLVAGWILPALSNGLYISEMDVPNYWREAAKTADGGDPNARTLMLPGQTRPTYRWTVQRPDDLTNSLLKREAVLPETTPNASAPGANLLAAMDDTVQSDRSNGDIASTFARYLGADNVLVRHDTVWENDGGARPAAMSRLIDGDSGLYGVANFGRPGQNVLSPTNQPESMDEALLTPVQLYGVKDSRRAVRAQSLAGQMIVAGDGWAFPQLASAGLLRSSPTVRYAQDLDETSLKAALKDGARLAQTDTNARRNTIPQRLTAGQGSLLAANEALKNSRTLGTDPKNQTVLERSGAHVTASSAGGTFFDLPFAAAENAFDGDDATSWRFGDFQRAAGQSLNVKLDKPARLGDVSVAQADLGPVKIDRATLIAGGKSVSVRVPDTGRATFRMGGVNAESVRLRIDSTRGDGYNLVGVSEVGLPGAKAERAARTPSTLKDLYDSLDAEGRTAFEKAPLDILFQRVQNSSSPNDDSETSLNRIFTMPDARRYDASATVRLAKADQERFYDRSAGYSDAVTASSSEFWFDRPEYRASQAADDNDKTAWVPGGASPKGAWWQMRGPEREISSVSVTQAPGEGGASRTQWATRATVSVDGRVVGSGALKPNGTASIDITATRGKVVRVQLDASSGPRNGAPAKFTSIDTKQALRKAPLGAFDEPGKNRCFAVSTINGTALPMRLSGDRVAGPKDAGTRWTACNPVVLKAREQHVEPVRDFVVDSLVLRDTVSEKAGAGVSPAPVDFAVTKNSPSVKSVRVAKSSTPKAVVLGQSYDERWSATLGDKDLGRPVLLDGYSSGWVLPAGAEGTVEMRFTPQRYANWAILFSLAALLLAAALVVRAWLTGALVGGRDESADEDLTAHRAHRSATQERMTGGGGSPGRSGRQVLLQAGFVVAAALAVGLPGLVAGLAVVAGLRWGRVTSRALVVTGAALVFVAILLFLVLSPDLGEVSADAISASLWPHRVAGAGFVVAIAGLLRREGLAGGSRGAATAEPAADATDSADRTEDEGRTRDSDSDGGSEDE